MSEAPTPEVPVQKHKRLPFDQELQARTRAFMEAALEEIPELEAMAVTFSYPMVTSDYPYAMVMGQSGPLRTPTEIVHMSHQLFKTLNFQLQQAGEYIRQVDEHMAAKAKELAALQEQIANAERELTGLQVKRDACEHEGPSGEPESPTA